MGDINIQLASNNQLLQRFIASRVAKEREVEISTLAEEVQGYVTGLDQKWVQITRSSDASLALIQLETVTMFSETGKGLSDHPASFQRDVRRYADLFQGISKKELAKGGAEVD